MTRAIAPAGPLMPFGKHRGKPLKAVATDYLNWMLEECRLLPALRVAVRAELRRRAELIGPIADGLPRAPSCVVEGVELNQIESGLFHQAVERGELVIELHMPCSSPVPLAWK